MRTDDAANIEFICILLFRYDPLQAYPTGIPLAWQWRNPSIVHKREHASAATGWFFPAAVGFAAGVVVAAVALQRST